MTKGASEETFHLGIKALIRNEKGQILVLRATPVTYTKPIPDHWDLPGGRIQKGETIEQALRREVEEETGVKNIGIITLLDASISKIRITSVDCGLILFTYLCSIPNSTEIKILDSEHQDYEWAAPKEAANLLKIKFSDSLVKIVRSSGFNKASSLRT